MTGTNLAKFAEDSILAGGASFTTGAIINPTPTELQTIYIPLITGILAPLIKELILTLRDMRRNRKECDQINEKEK